MVIEFPSKCREIATLADLLIAVERPWVDNMDAPSIAVHISRMRFVVQTLSELLEAPPSTVSTEWLLSMTVSDLRDMALRVAPPYRREFIKSSLLLIRHAQLHRNCEPSYLQPVAAGLKY